VSEVPQALPLGYADLLRDIKQRVQHAQTRAVLAINAELIRLYWDIGALIDKRQQKEGWGAGVIPRLARDLHNALPEEKGFSERNIKRMLAFYREYPLVDFVPQAVAQSAAGPAVPQTAALFEAQLLQAIPWGHHAELMAKVKDLPTRRWYMQATLQHGWSRNILVMQIESAAHHRQGRTVSNFAIRLPSPDSDLVQQALKDPYLFDFLTLEPGFHERELETGLVAHLEKFLLKLGHETDQPTIGLILCQQPNRVLAEYALRGVDKPIGVSSYELTRALPEKLGSSLPSIEEIERELQGGEA
jgi:predicted nuclease of restriction endonuclease-like (RecB) superfamily